MNNLLINNKTTVLNTLNPPLNFKNLIDLAESDTDYLNELKTLYIKFLKELSENYAQALLNIDSKNLNHIAHKAKPSLALLELTVIEQEIAIGKELIKSENPDLTIIHESATRMKDYCFYFMKELENSPD